MGASSREENEAFEDEVRRIARELWPSAELAGAANELGRERDGIFETEDCVHLIEATVPRKVEKVRDDAKKLSTLCARKAKSRPWLAVRVG
jgi:hypothetical protein